MIAAAITALISHWRRHPVQLFTLLAGLALATGLWSAVQAINAEARAAYERASQQLGAGQLDELQSPRGTIPLSTYVALRRAGWQVAAVLDGQIRVNGRSVDVLGVDLLSYPALPAVAEASEGAGIAPVDALTAPGLLFVQPELVPRLGDLAALPPVAVTRNVPPNTILTDIGTAAGLLDRPDTLTRMLILPEQPAGRPGLDGIAPDLNRVAAHGAGDVARLTDSFHLNLTAFGLLSFAVGLFIVHGAVGLAFEQRRAMIRTLRAMGVPLRLLTGLILAELVVLALIGGAAGLFIGYLVAGALLPDVATTLRGLYGAPIDGALILRRDWALAGLAMAVAGTLAASLHALLRVGRMPLLSSPGQQAWRSRGGSGKTLLICGLALTLSGVGVILLFDGLLAGFVFLACLLMGSALFLPPILAGVLRLGQSRARSALAEWVWADMRAQLPGLSLALMALLLALAANVGVGTMVASFRLTFEGWLDQRLTSELYVTADTEAQADRITDWLAPRADAVLPIRSVEMSYNDLPLFLYGIVDHRSYRDTWPLIASGTAPWDRLFGTPSVLINEQMARRENLWPGDRVLLAPDWEFTVAGVYSDYGNPTAQAIVAMDVLLAQFENVPNRRFGVRIAPDRAGQLAQDLNAAFDLPPGSVVRQSLLKARSRAIFERTFVVTGALNFLTLGVASFAILTSLLTLWTQRLPQLAPAWALGLTRAELARLEILRSVLLAALTAALALPLGLLLAWVLLAIINVEAFGWRLPMYLFPLDWLKLFGLALLAAILAAALPARKLRQVPPSELLGVFANER